MTALDLRAIRRAAGRQGFRVEHTGGNHLRFVPPDPTKPLVVMSGTPGDVRAIRNLVAALRRAGFSLDRDGDGTGGARDGTDGDERERSEREGAVGR